MPEDDPILLMPASDLPDAIEFASDTLARWWLQHLGCLADRHTQDMIDQRLIKEMKIRDDDPDIQVLQDK